MDHRGTESAWGGAAIGVGVGAPVGPNLLNHATSGHSGNDALFLHFGSQRYICSCVSFSGSHVHSSNAGSVGVRRCGDRTGEHAAPRPLRRTPVRLLGRAQEAPLPGAGGELAQESRRRRQGGAPRRESSSGRRFPPALGVTPAANAPPPSEPRLAATHAEDQRRVWLAGVVGKGHEPRQHGAPHAALRHERRRAPRVSDVLVAC